MTELLLSLHNVVRWVVVVLAVAALVRAALGWRRAQEWTELDDRLGLFFSSAFDVQVLLGLILYFFFSPTLSVVGVTGMSFGEVMQNSAVRYFAVEHLALMLAAMVLIHVGRSRAKKAEAPADKHKQALIFYGIALLLTLAAIPWPFIKAGHPWLRLGGFTI